MIRLGKIIKNCKQTRIFIDENDNEIYDIRMENIDDWKNVFSLLHEFGHIHYKHELVVTATIFNWVVKNIITKEIVKGKELRKVIIQEIEAWAYAIRCIKKMDFSVLYKEALGHLNGYISDEILRAGNSKEYFIDLFYIILKKGYKYDK